MTNQSGIQFKNAAPMYSLDKYDLQMRVSCDSYDSYQVNLLGIYLQTSWSTDYGMTLTTDACKNPTLESAKFVTALNCMSGEVENLCRF